MEPLCGVICRTDLYDSPLIQAWLRRRSTPERAQCGADLYDSPLTAYAHGRVCMLNRRYSNDFTLICTIVH